MQGLKEGLKQDNILLSYLNSKQLIRGKKRHKFNLVNKQTQRQKEKIFFFVSFRQTSCWIVGKTTCASQISNFPLKCEFVGLKAYMCVPLSNCLYICYNLCAVFYHASFVYVFIPCAYLISASYISRQQMC